MLPREKVQNLIDRHLELEKELSSGRVEKKKFAEISKEYSDLNDIINQAKEYLSYRKDLEELNNIINDKTSDDEMKDFATSELETLKSNYEINEKKIKLFFIIFSILITSLTDGPPNIQKAVIPLAIFLNLKSKSYLF